ncbi:MAG: hypothetical protein GKR93_08125 [Gammaproteobacteria bacterium]|nr:hypothetical protein [Gammaproteobacteria bacterium]
MNISRLSYLLTFVLYLTVTPLKAQMHDPRALEADPETATQAIAPRLDGLGDHHIEVTSNSEDSQYFFDQGYRLTLGFNHSEALRAFKEAARLDPENAMAWWGIALVLGPNLNLPMQAEVVEQAFVAIQKAVSLSEAVSPRERDYIRALSRRYSNDPEADRAPLDAAYVDAMKRVVNKYPDDLDAATLYAAAIMNTNPWDYWYRDGSAKKHTEVVIETLRSVIERNPEHAGAHHYLIHTVEAQRPELGEASADKLGGLMPGAGHLVHMPSHIYMRIGRYADSYQANQKAIEADEGYITQCQAQGLYPLGYYPHNIHFLVWSAMQLGRSANALSAARKVADKIPVHMRNNTWPLFETFSSQPMYVLARFGLWDEVLAESRPHEDALFMNAVWHYTRGMAYVHKGKARQSARELNQLQRLRKKIVSNDDYFIGFGAADTLLSIAEEILTGEMAAKRGKYFDAIAHLQRAVRLEDSLRYNEPPDWYFPVRHILGAVLLEAGYPQEAEVIYWDDLRRNPENGYALYGLIKALEAQGNEETLSVVKVRFDKAWSMADRLLQSSRY